MQAEPRLLQVDRRPTEVRTPGERWSGVRRIAVVRHDRLGDLLLTVPAIAALRRTYPDAGIALLVDPARVETAGMIRGVADVVALRPAPDEMRRQLADLGADLAVCISRGAGTAWAACRAGIPRRVGPGRRFYSYLFQRRVSESRREGRRHEAEYALSFAHRAGASAGPAEFPLEIPASARERATSWLDSHGLERDPVVLHPGSGGSCPSWPAGHFTRLGELLRGEGLAVVVTRGPDETVRRPAGPPEFAGGARALAALLGRARLVVSNSTGPIHLAAALGRPTLALHAPWASCGVARWGPYSERGWGLVAHHPRAEAWSRSERRLKGPALMSSVAPETVLRCCVRMLSSGDPRT